MSSSGIRLVVVAVRVAIALVIDMAVVLVQSNTSSKSTRAIDLNFQGLDHLFREDY